MTVVAGSGSGGGGTSAVAKKATGSLVLPNVSPWYLPAAIGFLLLLVATWHTKAKPYVLGIGVLILLGTVLQWWPAFDTQITGLLAAVKPASS
jgi:hypothetical protein